jgi:NAD(P)H-dependent FMN reductase
MDLIKVKIIIGSTRKGRFSEKVAKWVFEKVKNINGIEAEILDLKDYPMRFFDEPVSPAFNKERHKDDIVQKWANKISEGDAFIIITPEYNHGYPAVLKNALDFLYYEWNKKPVGFISYGSVGGARVIEQLRLVAIELQMVPIRNAIHIPGYIAFSEENDDYENLKNSLENDFKDKINSFFEELSWWSKVLKKARNG